MTEGAASAPRRSDGRRISVIITNFNYGHFLKACLASVAAQVRSADEVIVVDDGSTDGSADALAETAGVRVIAQKNRGQAAAFNAGFAASSGDIVLFLDADDVLAPEALQVVDQRVFDLYDEYCHGKMDRREFLSRAASLTVAVGTGLAMAQALLPRYAQAQMIEFTDNKSK